MRHRKDSVVIICREHVSQKDFEWVRAQRRWERRGEILRKEKKKRFLVKYKEQTLSFVLPLLPPKKTQTKIKNSHTKIRFQIGEKKLDKALVLVAVSVDSADNGGGREQWGAGVGEGVQSSE